MLLTSLLFAPVLFRLAVAKNTDTCTAVTASSPPAHSLCHSEGTLAAPDYLAQFQAPTAVACAANCLQIQACKSFSYKAGFCSLYKQRVRAMGFQQSTSSKSYISDRGCYALQCPAIITTTTTQVTTTTTTQVTTTTVTPSGPSFAPCQQAVSYVPGGLDIGPNTDTIVFCNGGQAVLQADNNFVVYPGPNNGNGFETGTYNPGGCDYYGGCSAVFTQDGDFQILSNGNFVHFSTETGNRNATLLTFSMSQPYITITDNQTNILYSSG